MRIAAGIVGILIGISSLFYIGIFGGFLGSATSWLGSGPWTHGGSNSVSNLGQLITFLSYMSGLLAIVGGIVAFSNTRIGGIILGVSAFSHWYLLGFGVIGKVFILPIAAAAAFAFFAAPSGLKDKTLSSLVNTSGQTTVDTDSNAGRSFDRTKWETLIQYDDDIALVAERLRPLGQKWLDEFASSYLALNDKNYLSEIERKIVAAAGAEAEEGQRQLESAQQEQERAADQRNLELEQAQQEQERLAEARRIWRDRIWGTTPKKAVIIVCILSVALVALVAMWPKKYADPFSYCQAVVNADNEGEGGITDKRYIGPGSPPELNGEWWRCIGGEVVACQPGASGRACMKHDVSTIPSPGMIQYCQNSPPYPGIPMSVAGLSAYEWVCRNGTPVIVSGSTRLLDDRGYIPTAWHKVSPGVPK